MMTDDELKRGSLLIEGRCATWFDRPDGGWGCDLADLPRKDQVQILMAWLRDYRAAHAEFAARQRLKLKHGKRLVFLDEERAARGRRRGKHGR